MLSFFGEKGLHTSAGFRKFGLFTPDQGHIYSVGGNAVSEQMGVEL